MLTTLSTSYAIEQSLDDIDKLLLGLGYGEQSKIHLFGHSYGGCLAFVSFPANDANETEAYWHHSIGNLHLKSYHSRSTQIFGLTTSDPSF